MRQLQYLRELLEPGYSAYSASEKSVIMLLILLNSLVPRPHQLSVTCSFSSPTFPY